MEASGRNSRKIARVEKRNRKGSEERERGETERSTSVNANVRSVTRVGVHVNSKVSILELTSFSFN